MANLGGRLKIAISDGAARVALRVPRLERALVRACHETALRDSLRLGAIAVGYTRVLDERTLRIAEMGKYRLQVNVAEELGTGPYFFGDSGTLWLTPALLREGDACVDAGANIGHYTFLMASEVGPDGDVLTFEANPQFVEILDKSIALNNFQSRVLLCPQALYERSDEEVTFYVSVNSRNSGTSSLVDHGWFLRSDHSIKVKTVTLDDAARRAGITHFRLIKIDVERAEHLVIRGANELLSGRAVDYLIVELHAGSEAQRRLTAHGYTGWRVEPNDKSLVPLDAVDPDTFGDYLFANPRNLEELKRLLKPIARFL